MIKIIITGNTNKGKIALAERIKHWLTAKEWLNVEWPLEPSFNSEEDRSDYAAETWEHLMKAEIVIETRKHNNDEPLTEWECWNTGFPLLPSTVELLKKPLRDPCAYCGERHLDYACDKQIESYMC